MNQNVPIFLACDENYVPYLDVAIISIIKNASKDNNYEIIILKSDITRESQKKLLKHSHDNITIKFYDVKEMIRPIKKQLPNVFYYGLAAYFRLFIETAFPQYDKAIYIITRFRSESSRPGTARVCTSYSGTRETIASISSFILVCFAL